MNAETLENKLLFKLNMLFINILKQIRLISYNVYYVK